MKKAGMTKEILVASSGRTNAFDYVPDAPIYKLLSKGGVITVAYQAGYEPRYQVDWSVTGISLAMVLLGREEQGYEKANLTGEHNMIRYLYALMLSLIAKEHAQKTDS